MKRNFHFFYKNIQDKLPYHFFNVNGVKANNT